MPTPQEKEIADRLRTAREQAGLSQGQVAKILNYQRPTISEIEAARRKVTAEEIGKFADMYGVTIDWILGRAQPKEAVSSSLLLAARELGKLKKSDLDKVIDFLQTIKKGTDK